MLCLLNSVWPKTTPPLPEGLLAVGESLLSSAGTPSHKRFFIAHFRVFGQTLSRWTRVRESRLVLLLTCAALSSLSCDNNSLLSIQENGGKIVGVVRPDTVRATVVVLQVEEKGRAETGTEGEFELNNLLPGTYTLEVTAVGFSKFVMRDVRVFERGTTTVGEIQLSQRPSQIASTFPENGQLDFAMHSTVRISFREQMNRLSVEQAFSITPSVPGEFEWSSSVRSSFFTFRPTPRFQPQTEYVVRITREALTVAGDSLELEYNFGFTTQSVIATAGFPRNGDIFVRPRTTIDLRFNTFMDLESVEAAFLTEPQIPGTFRWSSFNRTNFVPSRSLFTDTEYVVALTTSAVDFEGNPLQLPLEFSFRTEPLRILSHSPGDRQTLIGTDISISVSFNSDMNQSSVEAAFSMSPSIAGEFQWFTSGSSFRFIPDAALHVNTIYEVRIETTGLDLGGKGLKNPFRFSFTTRP